MNALVLPTWRDEEWRYADFAALATLAPERFGEWKEIELAPGEMRRKCLVLDGSGPELHRVRLTVRGPDGLSLTEERRPYHPDYGLERETTRMAWRAESGLPVEVTVLAEGL